MNSHVTRRSLEASPSLEAADLSSLLEMQILPLECSVWVLL